MNIKIAFIAFIFSANLFACTTEKFKVPPSLHLPTEGRSGFHGMVVFGNGSYFMEHIPMLHPPHDFQIISSIRIKNQFGEILSPDLSQVGFTLKPKNNFSLNDLIEGRLKKFDAQLFLGSFEKDGKLILGYEDLTIEIQAIKLARQLPQSSKDKFFEVMDSSNNIFRTELITPQNSVQILKNMTTQKTLWCVLGPDFFESCQL